jgi:hypothetical protein
MGAAFRLNTWSAPGAGPAVLALENELHPGLDVPLSWLTGARFPSADVLGHAALVTLARADVDVVTHARCTRIAAGPRGARLTLKRDGAIVPIDTEKILVIPGMGRPRRVPHARDVRIQTAEEILAAASHDADAQAFFRPARDGSPIVVAGSGPSAVSLLALAHGHAPLGVLDGDGRFARTLGARPSIVWITGHQGPRSAREALAQWEGAAAPHTMPAVLATQAATVLWDLVHAESAGTLVVRRGRVDGVKKHGRALDVIVGGARVRAGRVALAIGYEPDLTSLGALAATLVPEHGRVPEAEDHVVIALRSSTLPVWLTGAVLEGLTPPNDRTGPLADHVGRALAVVDVVAPRSFRRPMASAPAIVVDGARTGRARVDPPAAPVPPSWAVTLPFDVALALAPFAAGRPRSVDVVLKPASGRVRVAVDGMSRAGAAAVASRILARSLAAASALGRMRVRVDVDRAGRFIVGSARLVDAVLSPTRRTRRTRRSSR